MQERSAQVSTRRYGVHAYWNADVVSRMVRYGMAAAGPFGTAGSQFAMTLYLLHAVPPSAFGGFSFLLTLLQLTSGLLGALFSAPVAPLLSVPDPETRQASEACLFAANLCAAVLVGVVFFTLAVVLGLSVFASSMFAGFAAAVGLRWYARAYSYATSAPLRTMTSDVVYGGTLLAGVGTTVYSGVSTLDIPCCALFVSAVAGLLPFGGKYFSRQFCHVSPRDLPRYKDVWRRHSGWSLVGVLTTEATANSHAYAVTLAYGPTAFAPLAASALLIRPLNILTNALTDFERPNMARRLAKGRSDAATRSVTVFRSVLAVVWFSTAVAAAVLTISAPRLVLPASYDPEYLLSAAALWMAVAGVRLFRTPDSAFLQGAGAFKPLAFASFISSGVSISAVTILLLQGGPLWSLGGILIGEATLAVWTLRQVRRWCAAAARGGAA